MLQVIADKILTTNFSRIPNCTLIQAHRSNLDTLNSKKKSSTIAHSRYYWNWLMIIFTKGLHTTFYKTHLKDWQLGAPPSKNTYISFQYHPPRCLKTQDAPSASKLNASPIFMPFVMAKMDWRHSILQRQSIEPKWFRKHMKRDEGPSALLRARCILVYHNCKCSTFIQRSGKYTAKKAATIIR